MPKGEGKGKIDLSEAIANNPGLLGAIQAQFGNILGQNSGLFDTLPKAVQGRIQALLGLQDKYETLEDEFAKELKELQKKYDALYEPLFKRVMHAKYA